MNRTRFFLLIALVYSTSPARGQDLNGEIENSIKAAIRKVGPSVVQITTTGGSDMVVTGPKGPAFRKAMGPTTGVIVSEDGYIISSSFNFINNPTNILVTIPGSSEPAVAERVANDKSRMLTLLKLKNPVKGLPVPQAAPLKEIQEGQWAIALGRSLETKLGIKKDQSPVVSVGIVSAVGRIWGKALQTDCKVSPVNYGGPIIDITGRVQGILVPASPKGDDETAGFEWYDSGIGFAMPLENVLATLPRLKEGKDLKRGLLGVRMKNADIYGAEPEIGEVTKDTAAARAGLKPGDVITEVDGKPVVRMAQVQHLLGPKYEGDRVSLKYRRGKETHEIKELELVGINTVVAQSFLGILPMRDDPKLGVEVRFVFAKSPAEKAGLKTGDRILKYGAADAKGLKAFDGAKRGRDEFTDFLNAHRPGDEVALEVKRKDGKTETVKATLDPLPAAGPSDEGAIPEKLPEAASIKKALEPLENTIGLKPPMVDPKAEKPKIETGLLKRNTPDGEHKYYVFVPDEYDPNIACAVLVWLHPPGKNKEADIESMTDLWGDFCSTHNILMVAPLSQNDAGWIASESDFVVAAVRDVLSKYTVDRQRVIAHGLGIGGQMAIHLGFNNRDLFRGVMTTGAIVSNVKDNVPSQRLSFYLAGGSLDPIVKTIVESRVKLIEKRYPTVLREIKMRGREYFEEAQLREAVRWIDSLDRQ
ncbi:MAG: PDZ domain-containing protein [Gemmataceae bacterium]